jgi:glycosyltransferase involved in cell wall biosynthesis
MQLLPEYSIAYFASLVENFPYSHMECMAAGIACVIGSAGGAHEVAEHNHSAVLTRLHPDNIARELIALLKDPVRRRQLQIQAQSHIYKHLRAEVIMQRMLTAYEQALQSGN